MHKSDDENGKSNSDSSIELVQRSNARLTHLDDVTKSHLDSVLYKTDEDSGQCLDSLIESKSGLMQNQLIHKELTVWLTDMLLIRV